MGSRLYTRPRGRRTVPWPLQPLSQRNRGMMRKVIWCGTAVLACVTIATTMAAYYVAENPDSVLAEGALSAWEVCSWFNPVLAMNRVPCPVVCADKPCPPAVPWMAQEEGPVPEPQEPPMPEVGEVPQIAEPIAEPIE